MGSTICIGASARVKSRSSKNTVQKSSRPGSGSIIQTRWWWMLAYRDRAHRDEVFAAFAADPEWTALLEEYEVPIDIEAYMMSAADYSALK